MARVESIVLVIDLASGQFGKSQTEQTTQTMTTVVIVCANGPMRRELLTSAMTQLGAHLAPVACPGRITRQVIDRHREPERLLPICAPLVATNLKLEPMDARKYRATSGRPTRNSLLVAGPICETMRPNENSIRALFLFVIIICSSNS